MLQDVDRFTNHLTTHCFMQCAVYTFSLHSIHWTVHLIDASLMYSTIISALLPFQSDVSINGGGALSYNECRYLTLLAMRESATRRNNELSCGS